MIHTSTQHTHLLAIHGRPADALEQRLLRALACSTRGWWGRWGVRSTSIFLHKPLPIDPHQPIESQTVPQRYSLLPGAATVHICFVSGASMPNRRTRVPLKSSVSPSMTRGTPSTGVLRAPAAIAGGGATGPGERRSSAARPAAAPPQRHRHADELRVLATGVPDALCLELGRCKLLKRLPTTTKVGRAGWCSISATIDFRTIEDVIYIVFLDTDSIFEAFVSLLLCRDLLIVLKHCITLPVTSIDRQDSRSMTPRAGR